MMKVGATVARVCPLPKDKQKQVVLQFLDEHRESLQKRGGNVVFLVDAPWFRRWWAPSRAGDGPLPPIDNRRLLADPSQVVALVANGDDDGWFPLRKGLVCVGPSDANMGGADAVTLPASAWEVLCMWYGVGPGPPLPRLQVRTSPDAADAEIQLYPSSAVTVANAEVVLAAALGDAVSASTADPHAVPLPTARCREVVASVQSRRVGLHNLGNSCFLNSVLQCLSHIKPLTEYFLGDQYAADINVDSDLGTKGKMARVFHDLLHEMRFQGKPVVAPLALLQHLASKYAGYAGLEQQDAHEVVAQLFDTLHEDVNKVTEKLITENPVGDGTNDGAVAATAWANEGKRENSRVKDTVGGLLHCELVCSGCQRKSVSFEYQQVRSKWLPIDLAHLPDDLPIFVHPPCWRRLWKSPSRLADRTTSQPPTRTLGAGAATLSG